jgi:folate-dependent phosphoribosylglycinamide formyltransferase PurN
VREDEAPSIHPGQAEFRVVTARKFRVCPASPKSFCNATVHVATLVTGSGTVVLQGKECEFLADTVEDLWARVLEKSWELTQSVYSKP